MYKSLNKDSAASLAVKEKSRTNYNDERKPEKIQGEYNSIYQWLEGVSKNAKVVDKNLQRSNSSIAIRAGVNTLACLAAGPINFAIGSVVPPIAAAPAFLAGITGTASGDVINRVLQKTVGSDLTHTLNTDDTLPSTGMSRLASTIKECSGAVLDYGFAAATEHTFPLAVTDVQGASTSNNVVTENIDNAMSLTYYRGETAKKAYQASKSLLEKINSIEERAKAIYPFYEISTSTPLITTNRTLKDIIKMADGARSALGELKKTAQKIGYPAAYLSDKFGPGHLGIEGYLNSNSKLLKDTQGPIKFIDS